MYWECENGMLQNANMQWRAQVSRYVHAIEMKVAMAGMTGLFTLIPTGEPEQAINA